MIDLLNRNISYLYFYMICISQFYSYISDMLLSASHESENMEDNLKRLYWKNDTDIVKMTSFPEMNTISNLIMRDWISWIGTIKFISTAKNCNVTAKVITMYKMTLTIQITLTINLDPEEQPLGLCDLDLIFKDQPMSRTLMQTDQSHMASYIYLLPINLVITKVLLNTTGC